MANTRVNIIFQSTDKDVIPKTKKINKELRDMSTNADNASKKTSKAFISTGTEGAKAGVRITKGMSAAKIGLGAAVIALGLAAVKSVQLSTAAAELENKYNVVFKGIEDSTNSWINTYADATARGENNTKEFLTTLQDLQTGYGASTEAAAKFSQVVVGVTNDLSSFSDVPVQEASEAIQSGLSGQFQALKRLGIGLNVAIINQSAYSASIGKTWHEMTNLQKREAILSGILKQSGNAVGQNVKAWQDYDFTLGDAAKTSDSLSNQLKLTPDLFKDIGAGIGNAFLPAVQEMMITVNDALKTFREWTKENDSFMDSMGELTDALGDIVGGLVQGLVSVFIVLLETFAKISAILAPLVEELYAYAQAVFDSGDATDAFNFFLSITLSILELLVTVLTAVVRKLTDVAGAFNDVDTVTQRQIKSLEKVGTGVSSLLEEYTALSSKNKRTEKEQAQLNRVISELAKTVPDAVSAVDEYGEALDINTKKIISFAVENKKAQLDLVKVQLQTLSKSIDFNQQAELGYLSNIEGNKKLSREYVRLRAEVFDSTNTIEESREALKAFRAEAVKIGGAGSELEAIVDSIQIDPILKKFAQLQAAQRRIKELQLEIKNAFVDTTNEASKQAKKMVEIPEGIDEAWSNILGLLDKFDEPLLVQLRQTKEIQNTVSSYVGFFKKGTIEFETWQKVTSLVNQELKGIQDKISKIDQNVVLLKLIGGADIVKVWDNIKKINEGIVSDVARQKISISEQIQEAETFLNTLKTSTANLSNDQLKIQEQVIKQAENAIKNLGIQLSDLDLKPLKDSAQSVADKYSDIFLTQKEAQKVQLKALKEDLKSTKDYSKALIERAAAIQREGGVTIKLTKEILELERVSNVVAQEINDLENKIKNSNRDALSTWDFIVSDITGFLDNFRENAKQNFADKLGVDAESLTPEEESAAVEASILASAFSGIVAVIVFLIQQVISLIASTEIWQNLMKSFQEVLAKTIEFAVVPLIEAIQPLLTIVIALVSVVANLLVPIFNMFAIFVQVLNPVFILLGNAIIEVFRVFLQLLPIVLAIAASLLNSLLPLLGVFVTLLSIIVIVLEILSPLFEILAGVIKALVTPIALIGGALQWLANVIFNLGKFISNVISNLFDPSKWAQGFKSTDLGSIIASSLKGLSGTPTISDFSSLIPDDIPNLTDSLVFGDASTQTQFESLTPGADGGGIFGGGTTVNQVPDITIIQHFNAPVIGEGGSEEVGSFVVTAIGDFLGIGGTVTWLGEEQI